MKKVWQGPELIVLCRGNPEEAVLQGCKVDLSSNGPVTKNSICWDSACKSLCSAPASS